MNKRGQVSFFVILGIILLIAIVLIAGLSFMPSDEPEAVEVVSPKIGPVQNHIQGCTEKVSSEAVYYVGQHGGYYNPPPASSIEFYLGYVPYYYLDNKINIPPIPLIESQISLYIKENMKDCVNLTIIEAQGYEIKQGEIVPETKISDKAVTIKLNYPISITKEGTSYSLTYFTSSIDTNILEMYSIAGELVKEHAQDPRIICISCIEELTREGITIRAVPEGNETKYGNKLVWYEVVDREFPIDEGNITLRWVVEA